MATNTTNYNLVKPATTDFYDIAVQNGNMDIIDQQMKKMDVQNATAKTTLVDADVIGLQDSADSNKIKKITWANIKAVLGNLFASKVSGATNGNFAALNASGNLTDSGKKSTDFAPSGYGLGVNSPEILCGTPAEVDALNKSGLYRYGNNNINLVTGITETRYCLVRVESFGGNDIIQYCFTYGAATHGQYTLRRYKTDASTWSPWEWLNPAFVTDVVYRTTDRRYGVPVYKKKNTNGTVYWSTDQINWYLDTPEVGVRSATVES